MAKKKHVYVKQNKRKNVKKEFQPVTHSERKIANKWIKLNFCLRKTHICGARHL